MNSTHRPKPTWLVILAIAGLTVFVLACGGSGSEAPGGVAQGGGTSLAHDEELPTVELQALWAWGDAEQLTTLTNSAGAVFRGYVVALKGQRPALSQPDEGGPEAPRWADFPISQFEVRVESVVSGSPTAGTSVIFEQTGGVQTRADGSRVRLMLEGDEPIEVGQTYLFFGSVREDGIIEAPPFGRMKVQADGSLAAGPHWAHLGALQQLSRMHMADAERQIRAAAGE